jgi:hypothetical protein
VRIDWGLDAAIRTQKFVGLVFGDETTRNELEAERAIAVAQQLGFGGVVVLGIREHEGRRAILGSLLSIDTGKTLRSAAVVIEPTLPAEDTLRGLARFLAGGKAVPGVIVPTATASEEIVARPSARSDRRAGSRAWKWLALGSGIAVAGTGAWLIHIDGPIIDSQNNYTAEQYETKTMGIVALATGAALVGVGVVLWLREPTPERARKVGIVPTQRGLAITLGGTF